ncbi:DUF697 domain-containing protein [Macrococcus hajekii]|uniref:DUF697 domain-containing protein n=1 Tax=Macrococcus hajekii TaxID=198482 RepID=A0A4R6BNB5_9STAP|nr:DUF697 domain-containing protein [Macrococcus hajekii]TDM03340.1 DUF697 domain-containing protein [Macrococcus hajekii]GGA98018.1 hypothetical protein GCM10007190_02550 [Macrococcus hajekii]
MGILDTVINQAAKSLNNSDRAKLVKGDLPSSETQLIERRETAEKIVTNKSLKSSAAAVIPIPGVDVGIDLKLMSDIIEEINAVYGLSHKQVNGMADDMKQKVMFTAARKGSDFIGRKVTTKLLTVFLKAFAKREAAKQVKWIPVVGQAVAGGISYMMMKKLGNDHIDKCEQVARSLM